MTAHPVARGCRVLAEIGCGSHPFMFHPQQGDEIHYFEPHHDRITAAAFNAAKAYATIGLRLEPVDATGGLFRLSKDGAPVATIHFHESRYRKDDLHGVHQLVLANVLSAHTGSPANSNAILYNALDSLSPAGSLLVVHTLTPNHYGADSISQDVSMLRFDAKRMPARRRDLLSMFPTNPIYRSRVDWVRNIIGNALSDESWMRGMPFVLSITARGDGVARPAPMGKD